MTTLISLYREINKLDAQIKRKRQEYSCTNTRNIEEYHSLRKLIDEEMYELSEQRNMLIKRKIEKESILTFLVAIAFVIIIFTLR